RGRGPSGNVLETGGGNRRQMDRQSDAQKREIPRESATNRNQSQTPYPPYKQEVAGSSPAPPMGVRPMSGRGSGWAAGLSYETFAHSACATIAQFTVVALFSKACTVTDPGTALGGLRSTSSITTSSTTFGSAPLTPPWISPLPPITRLPAEQVAVACLPELEFCGPLSASISSKPLTPGGPCGSWPDLKSCFRSDPLITLPVPTELAARSGFLTWPFFMWLLLTASFLISLGPIVAAA